MAIDPRNLAGTAELTFADEFNTLNLWNGTSGTWSTNLSWGWQNGHTVASNGDQQWYIDANYGPTASVRPWSVSNGVLSITAAKADPSIRPYINNYEYTSGLINSSYSFTQQYGYFEMSAQLPKGQGFWPAFWLLPANNAWPPEIDIMEVLGHQTTSLYTFVHTATTGSHTYAGRSTLVADMSLGFHTYGMNWQADNLTWYFDGVEVFKTPTPGDLHQPMYIVANLQVGSYWPGRVDVTTPFPSSFKIDYIRAYEDLGTAPPPSTGSVSVSDVAITEGQSGTQVANFTVTRTGGTAAFSVNYATSDGSATAGGGDYAARSGTLQFGAGVNSQTVSVTINGDGKFEPTETFFINLSGATNGIAISDSQGVGTISNDDANHTPVVTAPDRTMSTGQSIAATALFTVSDVDDQAMIQYALWDGTAASNSGQFVTNGSPLPTGQWNYLSPTQLSQTVFVVGSASDGLYVSAFDGLAWAAYDPFSITSNTPAVAGSVSISDVTVTEGQSGTQLASFTIARTGGTAAFSINYATSNGSATTAGGDYAARSGTLQFGAGVNSLMIAVTINGDIKFEPAETFFFNLSGATNGAIVSDSQGIGTISNDDANHAPVVTAPDRTMSTGQSMAAASLFTVSDLDDQAMTQYAFWDGTSASNSGQFFTNGNPLPAGQWNYLSPAQLSQTVFVAGNAQDALYVAAFDGSLWAQYDQFSIF